MYNWGYDAHRYKIGTIVDTYKGVGVVIGHAPSPTTLAVFVESKDVVKGYSDIRVASRCKKVRVKDHTKYFSLISKAHQYLLQNVVHLPTEHFVACYEHWQLTGEYNFDNPLQQADLQKIEKLKADILTNSERIKANEQEIERISWFAKKMNRHIKD